MDDEEDPFANMRPARSATRRKAVREAGAHPAVGTAPPTIVETEAFGSRSDDANAADVPEVDAHKAGVDALIRRGDDSMSRLAMAAAMSTPSAPEALAPPGATMPESVSSFGSRAPIEAPDVGGKQRRASNDGAVTAPARTQAQMPAMGRAAEVDVEPPRLAPVVVNVPSVAAYRRASPRPAVSTTPARGVPGWVWFGLGVFVGVCLTILLGLTLGLTLS